MNLLCRITEHVVIWSQAQGEQALRNRGEGRRSMKIIGSGDTNNDDVFRGGSYLGGFVGKRSHVWVG
jgi:hypothetical protein